MGENSEIPKSPYDRKGEKVKKLQKIFFLPLKKTPASVTLV